MIFLGSDSQFWKTNGINAVVASLPIQNLVQSAVGNAYISNPKARFFAGYNEQFAYYFCNVNDMQFVYKWDTQIWTLFQGWPNGPILNATDNNGIPSLYVASNVSSQLGLFQVGVPGTPDNTLMPSVYYKTAWLHAGDPEILKLWHWIAIMAYNTGTVYSVTARGLARSNDGSFMQTDPIYLKTAPQGTSGNPFILNVSILDGPNVLVPPGVLGLPSAPVLTHGRLACPVVWEADSMCRGYLEEVSGGGGTIYEDLKANAVQFTIAWYSGTQDFDLLGLQSRFLTRAYRREGGDQYDSEAGVPNPHDPFVYAPLLPNDTAEQS